eukprot:jgi/Ulvmu1/12088/UM084_0011.1
MSPHTNGPPTLRHKTTTEFSVYPYDACPANCVLALTAPAVEDVERAPVSCSFVLDTSGSMSGNKIELMRKASQFSLEHLAAKDYLGLISFSAEVKTLAPVRPITQEHRAAASLELEKLAAMSRTNLAGGLFEGITQQLSASRLRMHAAPAADGPHDPGSGATQEDLCDAPGTPPRTPPRLPEPGTKPPEAQAAAPADPICSVFLFTDGKANAGLCGCVRILETMENMLAGRTAESRAAAEDAELSAAQPQSVSPSMRSTPPRIRVHTFGFGKDADSYVLSAIAEKSSGTYYFIDNPDDIPPAFADALGGMLSVAAQNVVLRISPVNGARIACVRCGFDVAAEDEGYVVRLTDLYAEEVKDIVVAFDLPAMHGGGAEGAEGVLGAEEEEFVAAEVRVEYIDTVRGAPAVLTGEMRVRRAAEAAQSEPDARVHGQVARLDAMEAMRRAMSLAEGGDYGAARGVLRGVDEDLESLGALEAPDDGSEASADIAKTVVMVHQLRRDVRNLARGYRDRKAYAFEGGAAHTRMLVQSHSMQRSAYDGAMWRDHVSTRCAAATLPVLSESVVSMSRAGPDTGGASGAGASPARQMRIVAAAVKMWVRRCFGKSDVNTTPPAAQAADTSGGVRAAAPTAPMLHPTSAPNDEFKMEPSVSVYSNALQSKLVHESRSRSDAE